MVASEIWPATSNQETAWLTLSKKTSECGECGAVIERDDAFVYRRRPRFVACAPCGVESGLQFVPSRSYEAMRRRAAQGSFSL